MAILLRPFLRLLGISKDATNLTIIGITLGLSFGGGLLINEAKKGHISARDVFTAIMLLNLLHSLIEDTLLIMLIGADFYTIFWGRLVFSVLVIALISNVIKRMNPRTCERYFYRDVSQRCFISKSPTRIKGKELKYGLFFTTWCSYHLRYC